MEAVKERHRVWNLTYHLVLVVKYRKPCISKEIGDYLVEETSALLTSWGGKLLEGKADKDHLMFPGQI